MGGDSFTEVSSQGWFSRIVGSIVGIPVGLLLFLGSFVVLFWNEGRAVRTARSLAEGEKAVISVGADRVDPAHEGALIHTSGTATTDETLKDPEFPVSARALRLVRVVKMYQWNEKKETRKRRKVGGSEERTTVYSYTKDWADHPIDSAAFHSRTGHENPREWKFRGWSGEAGVVTLGAFRLPSDLVHQINKFEPVPVDEAARDALPEDLRDRLRVDNGRLYQGASPANPEVGDVTLEFQQVKPTAVSLLAQQAGGSFRPYQTKSGDAINRLQLGAVSADDMFRAAEAENNVMTWVLRLVGFILMSVGIGLVLRPLAVFGDVIPFIGSVIRFGTGFVAMGISLVLSLITIALGWITYRPVVGVAVLAAAGLALFGFLRFAAPPPGRVGELAVVARLDLTRASAPASRRVALGSSDLGPCTLLRFTSLDLVKSTGIAASRAPGQAAVPAPIRLRSTIGMIGVTGISGNIRATPRSFRRGIAPFGTRNAYNFRTSLPAFPFCQLRSSHPGAEDGRRSGLPGPEIRPKSASLMVRTIMTTSQSARTGGPRWSSPEPWPWVC